MNKYEGRWEEEVSSPVRDEKEHSTGHIAQKLKDIYIDRRVGQATGYTKPLGGSHSTRVYSLSVEEEQKYSLKHIQQVTRTTSATFIPRSHVDQY